VLSRKKIAQIASRVWGRESDLEPFHGDLERFARLVEAEALRKVARAEFSYARPDTRPHTNPTFVVNVCDMREQARQAARAAKEGK